MKNIITLAAILLAIPTLILAAEKEDELISKVTAAYGGEALVNLENYRIEELYLSAAIGQSHSPSLNPDYALEIVAKGKISINSMARARLLKRAIVILW